MIMLVRNSLCDCFRKELFQIVVFSYKRSAESRSDAVLVVYCFIDFCSKLIFSVSRISISTGLGELNIHCEP